MSNSRDIRLPQPILDKYQIRDTVEVDFMADGIMLKPTKNPREGWEQSFQQMHENNDDQLLIPDIFDNEILEEG